jgi:hypothetical protein
MATDYKYVRYPHAKPSKTKYVQIAQIEYHIDKYESNPELLLVFGYNNQRERDLDNPYPWRVLPAVYTRPLAIAFYRIEILKIAAKDLAQNGGITKHIECAAINLLYLDQVLDALWRESKVAASHMSPTWECKEFERWVRREYHIHRHSPEDVAIWESQNPEIAWSNVNIGILGALTM